MSGIVILRKGRRWRRPFSLSAAVLGALACSTPGHAAMRGYIVTDFDTIRVEAPVRVVLTTGGGVSGRGEGDRAALDDVELSVSGRTLTVRMASMSGGRRDDALAAPTVFLSTGQLRRAQMLGGGSLTIEGLDALEADLSLSGNGEIVAREIAVERLNLFVGGGGRMTVAGTAKTLRASVNGVGTLDGKALVAKEATVANDGAGAIALTVNGPAKVVATGSGATAIGGNPACVVDRKGIGEVVCGSAD